MDEEGGIIQKQSAEVPPWEGLQTSAEPGQGEPGDIRAIKIVVSVTLGLTLLLSAGYLAAVVLSDGAILLRPSELALERHEAYDGLVNHPGDGYTGNGIVVCIVDSGIDLTHSDLEDVQLAGWKDFVKGRTTPYDDHGHGTSMAGILV